MFITSASGFQELWGCIMHLHLQKTSTNSQKKIILQEEEQAALPEDTEKKSNPFHFPFINTFLMHSFSLHHEPHMRYTSHFA